jgi:carboxypeptidase Q
MRHARIEALRRLCGRRAVVATITLLAGLLAPTTDGASLQQDPNDARGAGPQDGQPRVHHSPADPTWLDRYRQTARVLIGTSLASRFAWDRLAELTDAFGHRLSGSANLERAAEWAADQMRRDGFENVRLEKVMVPRWVRGAERAEIIEPAHHPVAMLGLGGSVGTPPSGIEAEVVVVRSLADLQSRAVSARGRMVLFNAPFTSYGETVTYRAAGPSAAAAAGAVAALVRAVGPVGLRTPHTGALRYSEDAPKIPAAAVSAEDADRIQRLTDRGQRVVIRLQMEARQGPDSESANVVGEIVGRERPEEIVLAGGHFDSWDVGTGASDDAVGCIVTWETARLLKAIGVRPRRTVRIVLWTNEENGLRGALAYRDRYAREAANHVLAVESDSGVFAPIALGFSGSSAARQVMQDIASLIAELGLDRLGPGGGGADIAPIAAVAQVPMLSLGGDPTRYFTIHHTPADTVDRIAPDEVSRAAAALAVLVYVVAEMPERLPS